METQTEKELVRAEAGLEIEDPAFFRDLIKAVSKVTEEPILTLDPEGIRVMQMSHDHRAMVDLFIPRDYFWTYNVYEERKICFNAKDLLKLIFKRGKMKGTLILMRIEEYRIHFDIKQGGRCTKKVLPLIEPIEEKTPEPKLYYNSRVKIITETLINSIQDAKTIDDVNHMLITVNDNEISFTGVNSDYEVENTYNQYADEILSFITEGTQKTYYDIDTLLTLVKTLKPITEAITLEYSTDMPIRITPELPIDGHLMYHLAPCVDDIPEPQEDQPVEAAAVDVDAVVEADPYEESVYCECGVELTEENMWSEYTCKSCALEIGLIEVDPHEDPAPPEDPAPVEIPAPSPDPVDVHLVEADPDQLSPGELYLKYYAEALARHTAEDA